MMYTTNTTYVHHLEGTKSKKRERESKRGKREQKKENKKNSYSYPLVFLPLINSSSSSNISQKKETSCVVSRGSCCLKSSSAAKKNAIIAPIAWNLAHQHQREDDIDHRSDDNEENSSHTNGTPYLTAISSDKKCNHDLFNRVKKHISLRLFWRLFANPLFGWFCIMMM